MYNEFKCLASNMGFTVASKTNFEQKQISAEIKIGLLHDQWEPQIRSEIL